jgi:hypothetical protein
MRVTRNAYKMLVGESEAKNHLEDLGMDGRVNRLWECGQDSVGLGQGPVAVSSKYGIIHYSSIKGERFLDQSRDLSSHSVASALLS